MKQVILLFLFAPLYSLAQKTHRFENDTLYTSCGYKIYPGQTLQFGKANDWVGFRYVKMKKGARAGALENNSVLVKELSRYGTSPTGSATIDVHASIIYKDGSKGSISFSLAFELAIGSRLPGNNTELLVPEAFRINKQQALAQNLPSFENDTLYTSCGYNIYKGRVLSFGNATDRRHRFRYVNLKNDYSHRSLENRQLRVKEVRDFGISVLGNNYITIIGTVLVNNTDRVDVEIHMAFDHAIENIPGVPSELIVPDEFRNRLKRDPKRELERLEDLRHAGIISKEELELYKKNIAVN